MPLDERHETRLGARGVEALRRDVPDQGAVQLFIQDPNGVTVELNFAGEDSGVCEPVEVAARVVQCARSAPMH